MNRYIKKTLLYYPLLFALFPILFLYAYNTEEVPLSHLWIPTLISLTGTLVILLTLRFFIKDSSKAAIFTTFFLITFFSYGHIKDLIYLLAEKIDLDLNGIMEIVKPILWSIGVVIVCIGILIIEKTCKNSQALTKFLSITAVILFLVPLVSIGIHKIQAINHSGEPVEYSMTNHGQESPDIYYIVLDCYERQDTLKTTYGYDNSEFINYLTDKGFYVAQGSCSNYYETLFSLSSSLNMEYLENVTIVKELGYREEKALIGKFQNNKVSQFLKSVGYQYIYVSSSWYSHNMERYADVYEKTSKLNNFSAELMRTTLLSPFVYSLTAPTLRDTILYTFDKLPNLPSDREPLFVFAHICSPHGPFVFGRDGDFVKEGEGSYIEQLIFVNKKTRGVIDEILAKSKEPPIIIIQGDTGQSSYNILNAYYLPGKNTEFLYETISPVNSFRVVFNLYFGTDYELLEDRME